MITPTFIINQVCISYGISRADIFSQRRNRQFSRPRQIAMLIIKEKSTLSYPAIGRIFNRDHTTIVHACKAVRKRDINRDLLYLFEDNTAVMPEVRMEFEKTLDIALDDFKRALCIRLENNPIRTLAVLAKALDSMVSE